MRRNTLSLFHILLLFFIINIFKVVAQPTIDVQIPSMSGFTTDEFSFSNEQFNSFTATGLNPNEFVTITASPPYLISTSSGSGYLSALLLSSDAFGDLIDVPLYIILGPGGTPGSILGSIEIASISLSVSNSIGVDGTVTAASVPSLSVIPTSFQTFTANPNTESAEQSIFISGTDLTSDITISLYALTEFEISNTSGIGFSNQVIFTQSAGIASGTLYVRLKPGVNPFPGESLSITTDGTADISIDLNGVRIFPPMSITSINPNPIERGNEVTVFGANFYPPIFVDLPGKTLNVNIIDDTQFTFVFPANFSQSSITLTFTGAIGDKLEQPVNVTGAILPPLMDAFFDYSNPLQFGISPTTLYVNGSNFNENQAEVAVFLGQNNTSFTPTTVSFIADVPYGFTKGHATYIEKSTKLQTKSNISFFTSSSYGSVNSISGNNFGPSFQFTVPNPSSRINTADLDNDGNLELIVLPQSPSTNAYVYKNILSGSPAYSFNLGNSVDNASFADFDADGDLDLYFFDSVNSLMKIFFNTSNIVSGISFSATPLSYAGDVKDAKITDVNNDGILDILFISSSSNFQYRLGTINGSNFSLSASPNLIPITIPSLGAVSANNIEVIDVDQDRDFDIVFSRSDVIFENDIYRNVGTNGEVIFEFDKSFPGVDLNPAFKSGQIVPNNIDQLITIKPISTTVGFYDFTASNFSGIQLNGMPTRIDIGNIDRDGFNDIAATLPSQNQLALIRGNGGAITEVYYMPLPFSPIDVLVEDMNNDGNPDILCLFSNNVVQFIPNYSGLITSLTLTGARNSITVQSDTVNLSFQYNPTDALDVSIRWSVSGNNLAFLDNFETTGSNAWVTITALDNGVVTLTASTLVNPNIKSTYVITISGQIAPPDILQSAMQLLPGDKYTVTTLTNSGLAYKLSSPPGAAQLWDISTVTTSGDSSLIEIVDAFTTPYIFTKFSTAIIAAKKADKYTYYTYSTTGSLIELGTASPNSVDSVSFTLFNPLSDFGFNSIAYPQVPFSIRNSDENYFSNGTLSSNYQYDAYGTLTLPDRSVKVGRIKIENYFGITGAPSDTSTTNYYYYEENEKYPLIEVRISRQDNSNRRTERFADTLVLLRNKVSFDTLNIGSITGIQIVSPRADTTVQVGEFFNFSASLTPSNANQLFLGWQVLSDTGAFILPNGDFYSYLPGQYTVKAFSLFDTTIFDTRKVTVTETQLSTLKIIKPANDTTIITNSFIQFDAITTPATTISSDIIWSLQYDIDYSTIPVDPLSGLPLDTNAFKNLGANIDFNGKFYAYIPGTYTVIGFAASNPNIFDYRIVTVTGDAVISVTSVALIEQDTIRVLSPLDPFLIMNPIFQPANATNQEIEWSTIPANSTLVGIETFPGFALASVIGDGNGVVTILGRSKSNPNAFGMWVITVVGKETLKADQLVSASTGDPCQGELVLKSPNQNGIDYQWFLNSLKIRGADKANYNAVVSGNYTLIVLTDGNTAETYPPFVVTISNLNAPTISGVGAPITQIISSRDMVSNASDTITQWYLNNRLIRGSIGRKLDVFYNGDYYATNKSGNCRIQSNVLGVNEPNYVSLQRSGLIYTDSTIENYGATSSGNTINIYPNPTSGLYNLDYFTSSKNGLTYSVFNYMSQKVVERTLTKVSVGLQTDSFDLSTFGAGIYYISINEENHKSKCIKIVVQ